MELPLGRTSLQSCPWAQGSDPCPALGIPCPSQTLQWNSPSSCQWGRGHRGSVPSSPFPHQGRRILPACSELVFALFPTSWQQAGGALQTWTCLVMDHLFTLTQSPVPSAPPGAQHARSCLGQGWAGAGAPQGLPQCPEVGSVPGTSSFQRSIC